VRAEASESVERAASRVGRRGGLVVVVGIEVGRLRARANHTNRQI
jgi:hypothetical protein